MCVCVFSLEFNLISSAFSDLFPWVALFKKDTADEHLSGINQVPHTRLQWKAIYVRQRENEAIYLSLQPLYWIMQNY